MDIVKSNKSFDFYEAELLPENKPVLYHFEVIFKEERYFYTRSGVDNAGQHNRNLVYHICDLTVKQKLSLNR